MKFKKPFRLGLALASLAFVAAAPSAYRQLNLPKERTQLIRYKIQTHFSNYREMSQLSAWLAQNNFDVAGVNLPKKEIEVISNESGIRFLESHGLRGNVFDTQDLRSGKQSGPDPRYLNPERVAQKLSALHQAFPAVTQLQQIGESLQGRPIYALLISSTPDLKNPAYYEKPSILFDGMHHAREVMTPEIVMDIAETLLNSGRQGVPQARQIVQDMNIWVVPMMNVDGNSIVWAQDNWWRKNARSENQDTFGVDPNRNYPYRFGDCGGSSSSKGNDAYRGSAAASEPETRAIMNLAELIQPVGYISYHSYSELVLYPYGCRGQYAPETVLLAKVGKELSNLLPSDSGNSHYAPGTVWEVLYPVDGDSISYMFAAHGALSYTFEVNQEFQPRYELREPTLKKHRVAWQYFLKRIEQNLLKIHVTDARTGQAAAAEIEINTIQHKAGERAFRSNRAGNFFKVLDPGNYIVTVKLADGRSQSANVAMSGAKQALNLTIE